MTNKEREFMFDLAELMAKYEVSIEATTFNDSFFDTPSVQIQSPDGEINIDLYGCLHLADILNMPKND
jgi:hypothetical protein